MLSLKDRIMIKLNRKKSLKILDEVYKKVSENIGEIKGLDQIENIKEKYTSVKKVFGKWRVVLKVNNQSFTITCFTEFSAFFIRKQLAIALVNLINKESL